jgi:hypothetical protein
VILEEAVDDDDGAPDQLLMAGDPLPDDRSVMEDELQVERRDQVARVAVAARGLADVTEPPPEREVAALDRVLGRGGVERLGEVVGERRVTLELRETEGRPERRDHGPDEVGEDVLGVVELGPREEARIARDVGDQQAGRLRFTQHRIRPSSWSSSAETGARVDR